MTQMLLYAKQLWVEQHFPGKSGKSASHFHALWCTVARVVSLQLCTSANLQTCKLANLHTCTPAHSQIIQANGRFVNVILRAS
jgi:hypothetical protein